MGRRPLVRRIAIRFSTRLAGVVLILALAAVVVWQMIGRGDTRLPPVDLGPLLVGLGLVPGALLLLGIRVRAVLASAGYPLGLAHAIEVAAAAYFLNASTPAGLGEIGRVLLLRRRFAVPLAAGLGSVIFERGVSLGITAGISVAALLAAHFAPPAIVSVLVLGVSVVVIAVFIAYVPAVRRPVESIGVRAGAHLSKRLQISLDVLAQILARLLHDPSLILTFAAATILAICCYGFQLLAVLTALGANRLDAVAAIGLFAASTIAGIVSAIPFGVGSADAILVLGLLATGTAPVVAAAAAVLLRIVNTAPLAGAGILASMHLHLSSSGASLDVSQANESAQPGADDDPQEAQAVTHRAPLLGRASNAPADSDRDLSDA